MGPRPAAVVRLESTLAHGGSPGTGSPSPCPPADVRRPGHNARLPTDGAQNSPTPRGRPYKATHPRSASSIRVSVHRQARAGRRHAAHARCLLANTSCGIARRLLACVLLVGQMGVGALTAPRELCRTSGGFRCGSSYLRAQLWTTLWMLPVVGARPSSPVVGGSGWVGGLDMTEGRRGEGSS